MDYLVAALNDKQIIQLSALIKNCIITNFEESQYCSVFVKSSTGFTRQKEFQMEYCTKNDYDIRECLTLRLVKAAGGVRTYAEAAEMIL
jgi:deoxyribose-phosphate aldolase